MSSRSDNPPPDSPSEDDLYKLLQRGLDVTGAEGLRSWREADGEILQVDSEGALRALPDSSQEVRTLVDRQAEDDGLWVPATPASEAYLQAALREIHKAVEGGLPGETK